jgi:hypothetical protein
MEKVSLGNRERERNRCKADLNLFGESFMSDEPTSINTPTNIIQNRVAASLLKQRSKNLPTRVVMRPIPSAELFGTPSDLPKSGKVSEQMIDNSEGLVNM